MDENRAEYTASTAEYEEALWAYEADSVNLRAQYRRILAEIDASETRHDSVVVEALMDSLSLYDEPMWDPRGHIGFNIAGAFFVVFILIMALSYTAFFGIEDYFGDTRKIYVKGASDIRWGIDISGGVEAVFSPDKKVDKIVYGYHKNDMITSDDLERWDEREAHEGRDICIHITD